MEFRIQIIKKHLKMAEQNGSTKKRVNNVFESRFLSLKVYSANSLTQTEVLVLLNNVWGS